jgi:hypothetical protein
MLDSVALQWSILPFGFLLLFLHVGPLVGIAVTPSIRGGTRWWFFAFELAVFVGWLLASPIVWNSNLARAVVVVHLAIHLGLALGDWFAHDRMLATALSPRQSTPWMWIGSKVALLIDTLTHVTVVALVVAALPWSKVVLVGLPALLGYVLVTLGYVHRFGERRLESWRES